MKSRCVFAAVVHFGKVILKVANVSLEAIGGPHLDAEDGMVVLLKLLVGRVLSEKQLGEIPEAMD